MTYRTGIQDMALEDLKLASAHDCCVEDKAEQGI
jgi:hypothetical protein